MKTTHMVAIRAQAPFGLSPKQSMALLSRYEDLKRRYTELIERVAKLEAEAKRRRGE